MLLCCAAVKWKDKKCRLLVHYDTGFTLMEEVEEGTSTEPRPPPTILWQYPYEKLRMSADDGHRLLWLDFTDDGEQVTISVVKWYLIILLKSWFSCNVAKVHIPLWSFSSCVGLAGVEWVGCAVSNTLDSWAEGSDPSAVQIVSFTHNFLMLRLSMVVCLLVA